MKLKADKQLWQHQFIMRDRMVNNDLTLMLAGCGTGKTLASACAIAEVGLFPALVITLKPSLRSVWEDDLLGFFDDVNPIILDKGTAKTKYIQIRDLFRMKVPNAVVVTNYETARSLNLEDFDWGLVVADEGHRFRGHNSQQSVQLAVALRNVRHKTTMTGTSWADRPTDVFGQVRFLEPKQNGSYWGTKTFGSWTRFFDRYVDYDERDHIKIPRDYINQPELADKLRPYFLHIDRDKVLNLPAETHLYRKVKLHKDHMKAYREFEEENIIELGGEYMTADNVLVLNMRLHQMAGGFAHTDDGEEPYEIPNGEAKLDALLGLLEEIGEDEPVIVWTNWREDVVRISQRLYKAGITYRVIGSGFDQHREWKDGAGRVLLANLAAGSASIGLTRARYAIYYSMNYSRTMYVQSVARISRPPQQHKTTFYYLLAEGTKDVEIVSALRTKQEFDDKLLSFLTTEKSSDILPSSVNQERSKWKITKHGR